MGKPISRDSGMNSDAYGKILVIKPSSLGDIIHALPAVEALHQSYPKAEISWVVNTEWMPLLEGIHYISKLIPFPRKELRGPLGFYKARLWANENIKGLEPDLTIDFQGLLRSGLMAKKAEGKHTIGFQNSREGSSIFYDEKVEIPNWNKLHAVDRYFALVHACGVPESPHQSEITLPPGEYISIKGLPKREKFILLHPFSRGEGKSLSKTEVVEFCEKLHPHRILIVGAGITWDDEKDPPPPDNALNLLDQTSLAQLIDLIRRATYTVSVDSGPMHLAAAITDRLLSIHTWSDPMMVGPWKKEAYIWRDSEIWQVDEIEADQFSEKREDREEFAARERIISEADMTKICEFVKSKI